MRKILLLAVSIPLLSVAAQAQHCDHSLLRHVYHPDRLEVQRACVRVTGLITFKKFEPDGDVHYRLKLSQGQGRGLLNEKNNGELIVEPICVHRPSSPNAAQIACMHFQSGVSLPNKGDRISVTGVLMLDKHHGWLEIHPVTSIVVLP